jgi:hypothetical protein
MTLIHNFPTEWYDLLVSQKFNLRSMNQRASRPFNNAGAAVGSRPHTQLFLNDVTFATLADYMLPDLGPILQNVDAFFTRARGSSGLIRMANGQRLQPWFNRNHVLQQASFSDGSTFSDGSVFESGLLPPEVQVYAAAAAGADYIVLSGFPVSTEGVLHQGDLLEIKPNGIQAPFPHLYKAMLPGDSNSSGRVGIKIEPRLHQGIAADDTVGLAFASTVFRMADDTQFDIEMTSSEQGTCGGSLIEALDLIP